MKTGLSILAFALMAGMATAAERVLWSEDGIDTFQPEGIYDYNYKGANATKADVFVEVNYPAKSTAKPYYIEASFTAADEKAKGGAGFGFAWELDEDYAPTTISVAAYAGVCLNYSATNPVRMDFKQFNISDDNYFGTMLPATDGKRVNMFVAFESLKMGWAGDKEWTWLPRQQEGVQFSYKGEHVKKYGTSNDVGIYKFMLADECPTHAPNLKEGVVTPDEKSLYEGDTLKVAFKDIFEDADGDDLNITMSMASDAPVIDLKGAKSYSLSDVALLKSKPNPEDGTVATVSFLAADPTNKTVKYTLKITLVDRDNPPVAVDDAFTVDEDAKLTVSAVKGVLKNDYDDDDDPENPTIEATLVESTTHGELTFSGSGFTYTPEADFHGEDFFTYFVTDGDGNKSDTATVTITVNNVEDPATFKVNNPFFHVGSLEEDPVNFEDGVTVAEDFEDFDIYIPGDNIEFSDPDVLTPNFPLHAASAKGLVEAAYTKLSGNHVISVSAVPNANGKDVIKLFLVDGKDTLGVDIPVTITGVADKPVAKNDAYKVGQDLVNKIDAASGVLANDVNPDGESVLKAYLFEKADHGTVKLETDGSFTYEVGDYEGEDIFTYFVVNAEGDTSDVAAVTLTVEYRNHAPVIVEGVKDTVGARVSALKEDFTNSIIYTVLEVTSWFVDPEEDAITISAVNPDSLLKVTVSTSGAITIKAVKDACGETAVNVIATDANKNSTTLAIPVSIACVNDVPVRIGGAADTILVPAAGWRKAFSVFDMFTDVDDTLLVLTVSDVDRFLSATVEGDSLIVKLKDETQYLQNHVAYAMKVSAADETGAKTIAPKILRFMVGQGSDAIPQVAVSTKLGWQGAILAERGMAAIFDMQGRVMWKHRLPVSEDAVRNAAAKVQGRKVLMVNKQTWTIK